MEVKSESNSNKKSKKIEIYSNKSTFMKIRNNSNDIFERSNNNLISSYNSQYISSNNSQNILVKHNKKSTSNGRKKSHHKKKTLKVNLTEDEDIYYNNIFESLDNKNIGKLDSKEAAEFLKKSGLSRNILKTIWLIASKSSISFIERNEFFVALRLIALAQNNFPYNEESVEKNTPLPPLPHFKYKIAADNERIMYKISQNNKIKYQKLFDDSKENNFDNNISVTKALILWKTMNAEDDLIKKIAGLLNPLEKKGFLNLKEFQVGSYIIQINDKYEIPSKLPLSLYNYLGRKANIIHNEDKKVYNPNNIVLDNSIDNLNEKNSINIDEKHINENMADISKNLYKKFNEEDYSLYIVEIMKRIDKLKNENNIVDEKLSLAKNKMNYLFEEINGLQKQRNLIQEKLIFINRECLNIIGIIAKNKNIIFSNYSYKSNDNIDIIKKIHFCDDKIIQKHYNSACGSSSNKKVVDNNSELFNDININKYLEYNKKDVLKKNKFNYDIGKNKDIVNKMYQNKDTKKKICNKNNIIKIDSNSNSLKKDEFDNYENRSKTLQNNKQVLDKFYEEKEDNINTNANSKLS